MSLPSLEVVSTSQQLDEFVAFPWSLYEGDPYWVPPIYRERVKFFLPEHNPFFEHSDVQMWLARRDGRVVGTIAGIINRNHNRFHEEKTGHFGMFECEDDPEAAKLLFDTTEAWIRAQGMDQMVGPLNFSTNDEAGLLIDGFDSAPVAMMTYNPRYYVDLFEANGFTKIKDLYAYIIPLDLYGDEAENLPKKIVQGAQKALRDGTIQVRTADMSHFEQELVRAKKVYNSAWGRNWGFVPMNDKEIEHLAMGLKPLIDPELVLIAEAESKPVGICVALPDVNAALLRVYPKPGGFLRFLYDGVRFLWAKRQSPKVCRLLIMGVIEEYRNRGIDAVFYDQIAKAALAKGYKECEMSWILEDNVMMNRIIRRLGGTVYKTYRLYVRPVA